MLFFGSLNEYQSRPGEGGIISTKVSRDLRIFDNRVSTQTVVTGGVQGRKTLQNQSTFYLSGLNENQP